MNPRKNETGCRLTLNNTCQVYLGVVDRRAHGCPVKTQESMKSLQGVSSKERCTDKTGLDLDSHRPLFDRLQYAIKTGLCDGLGTRTTGVLCADNRQGHTDTIEHSKVKVSFATNQGYTYTHKYLRPFQIEAVLQGTDRQANNIMVNHVFAT